MCKKCQEKLENLFEELLGGQTTQQPIDLEAEHDRALINQTRAETILTLAQAAERLNAINANVTEQRVLKVIEQLTDLEEPVPSDGTPVPESDLPEDLAALVEQLKQFGVDVQAFKLPK